MNQLRAPVWELLNQLKHKDRLRTLSQLQTDVIIQDYARPVIMLIQKAYNPPEDTPDAIVAKWENQAFQIKANSLKLKFESLVSKAGHSMFHRMKEMDDELDDIFTRSIRACWYKLDRNMFDDGPQIICFPRIVEQAFFAKTAFDPVAFHEASLEASENDSFHVENQHSQSLFDHNSDQDDEMMEPIEIIAVSGGAEV